jgi:hypothetical protein
MQLVYELCIGILMMCDDGNREEAIEKLWLKLSEEPTMASVNPSFDRTIQRISHVSKVNISSYTSHSDNLIANDSTNPFRKFNIHSRLFLRCFLVGDLSFNRLFQKLISRVNFPAMKGNW